MAEEHPLLKELDYEQVLATRRVKGQLLLTGHRGSGKTLVTARRALMLTGVLQVHPKRVLIITGTQSQKKNLTRRIGSFGENLVPVVVDIKEAVKMTLKRSKFGTVSFKFVRPSVVRRKLWSMLVDRSDMKANLLPDFEILWDGHVERCQQLVKISETRSAEELPDLGQSLEEALEKNLRAEGVYDYSQGLYEIVGPENETDIRHPYDFVMVDGLEDPSPAEILFVLKMCTEDMNIMITYDPMMRMIRGNVVGGGMRKIRDDFGSENMITLKKQYMTPERIGNAALMNKVGAGQDTFEKKGGKVFMGGALYVHRPEELSNLAYKINELVKTGETKYERIKVVCCSGDIYPELIKIFHEEKIPFTGARDLMHTLEGEELYLWVKAVYSQYTTENLEVILRYNWPEIEDVGLDLLLESLGVDGKNKNLNSLIIGNQADCRTVLRKRPNDLKAAMRFRKIFNKMGSKKKESFTKFVENIRATGAVASNCDSKEAAENAFSVTCCIAAEASSVKNIYEQMEKMNRMDHRNGVKITSLIDDIEDLRDYVFICGAEKGNLPAASMGDSQERRKISKARIYRSIIQATKAVYISGARKVCYMGTGEERDISPILSDIDKYYIEPW